MPAAAISVEDIKTHISLVSMNRHFNTIVIAAAQITISHIAHIYCDTNFHSL